MAKKKKQIKNYTKEKLTAKQAEGIKRLPTSKKGEVMSAKDYAKKTGNTSRRAYLNYQSKKAGFKDYEHWIKARKDLNLSTGARAKKGEKKPKKDKYQGKAYSFDWRDDKQEANKDKLKKLLAEHKGEVAQFVVQGNPYSKQATSLKDMDYVSTGSYPIDDSYAGWLRKIPAGTDPDDYLRGEFNITPYNGSKVYGNGIKKIWVYIQPR